MSCTTRTMKSAINVSGLPLLGKIKAYVTYNSEADANMSYVSFRGSNSITISSQDSGNVAQTASYGASHTYNLSSSSNQWQIAEDRSFVAEISGKYNITYLYSGTGCIAKFMAEDLYDCVNLETIRITLINQTAIEELLNRFAPFRSAGSTLNVQNVADSWTYNGSVMGSSETFTFDGQGGWSKN